MENKYRDPESKTKIKQIKGDAQKQIERNKIILKELINKFLICNIDHLHPALSANPTTQRKVRGIWKAGK